MNENKNNLKINRIVSYHPVNGVIIAHDTSVDPREGY